jgi:hypothetical protein
MRWRLDKSGRLVFRPMEHFAVVGLPLRLVGVMLKLRKVSSQFGGGGAQFQVVMSRTDARALAAALLKAAGEAEGAMETPTLN